MGIPNSLGLKDRAVSDRDHRLLFRAAVVDAQSGGNLGRIILVRPISFFVISCTAIIVAMCFVSFLFFADYTKRTQVSGILLPSTGVIKIQSPQTGIVVERRVRDGQFVNAGDVLYVVSSELNVPNEKKLDDNSAVSSDVGIIDTLQARQASLRNETIQQDSIYSRQFRQLEQTLKSLRLELRKVDEEVFIQASKLQSLQEYIQQYSQLKSQNYISTLGFKQKQDEIFDQQSRLKVAQRSQISLLREVNNVQAERDTLTIKLKREQSQLARVALDIQQATIVARAKRQFVITAPQAGTVTAIQSDVGQVATTQSMLQIIPLKSQLEAYLYVPSHAIGFIQIGQVVHLRYDAYPFQKFGQYSGRVKEISRNALSITERAQLNVTGNAAVENNSMFRVRVGLDSQRIEVFGKVQNLSSGLQFEADILHEKRRLIEWLFEPLYGFIGKKV